jgi:ParB family chromosome partitioning protein
MRHDEHYVETLTSSAGAPVGRIVAIDQVDPNPNQPRQVMGDLSELMASIAEKGIIEPIIVRQRGSRFQIVAGERRYQAAVQVGVREIPIVIREVDDNEIIEIALIENLQRKDLTPFEEVEAMHQLPRGAATPTKTWRGGWGSARRLRSHCRSTTCRGGQEPLSAGRHYPSPCLQIVSRRYPENGRPDEKIARDGCHARGRPQTPPGRSLPPKAYVFSYKAPTKAFAAAPFAVASIVTK